MSINHAVDETRVRLKGDPGVKGSDYINASFIDVSTAIIKLYLEKVCSII